MGSREGFIGQNTRGEETGAVVRGTKAVGAKRQVAIGYPRGY
jgi:hypothetical protein